MRLSAALEAGRRDVIDAALRVPPKHGCVRPSPKRWSAAECVEHVAIFEERYLRWILQGTDVEPRPDSNREMRLFSIMRSRLTPVETPDALRPSGRFDTLSDALAEFERVRKSTIALVEERGEKLYSVSSIHPYFGKVNGVELIQMIDAHARRHADQIREIGESFGMATKRQSGVKKAGVIKRDEPDLPSELETVADVAAELRDGEFISVEGKRLEDLNRVNVRIGALRVEGSEWARVQLAEGQFGSAVWKDVRLDGCDLANVRAHRMDLLRVAFVDCRLTGISSSALEWKDVLVRNGDVSYASFPGGSFRACEFVGCNWRRMRICRIRTFVAVFSDRATCPGPIFAARSWRTRISALQSWKACW